MNIIYICKLNLWFTGGEDFAEVTRNVKFNQGNSVAKFTIPIIKDRIFEGTEVFTIHLAKHKSAKKLNIEICNPSTAIGHIIDKGEKINVLSMHILYIGSVINGCFEQSTLSAKVWIQSEVYIAKWLHATKRFYIY